MFFFEKFGKSENIIICVEPKKYYDILEQVFWFYNTMVIRLKNYPFVGIFNQGCQVPLVQNYCFYVSCL